MVVEVKVVGMVEVTEVRRRCEGAVTEGEGGEMVVAMVAVMVAAMVAVMEEEVMVVVRVVVRVEVKVAVTVVVVRRRW